VETFVAVSEGKTRIGADRGAAMVVNSQAPDVWPTPAFHAVTDQVYINEYPSPEAVCEVSAVIAESAAPTEFRQRTV
jgi:hypothetical protein